MRKRQSPRNQEPGIEKPPRSKIAIIAIVAASAILAAGSLLQIFAANSHKSNPMGVLALFKDEPVANARMADLALGTLTQRSDFDAEIGEFARRSFYAQGLNSDALRHFGILAVLNNQSARADEIFAMAQRMSRRDALTSTFRHEYALALGDVSAAAVHLDNAARTSRNARAQLLPRAIEFLDTEQSRAAIAQELLDKPDWAPDFWELVAADPDQAENAALLRLSLPPADRLVPNNVTRLLARNLLRDNNAPLANALFERAAGAETARRIVRSNLPFTAADWPPFTWESFIVADSVANPSADGSALEFNILPGARPALLARRLIKLPSGRYELRFNSTINGPEEQAELLITCVSDQNVLTRASLGGATRLAARALEFSVQPGCDYQWIRVASDSNASQSIIDGRISDLTITSAN